MTKIKITRLKDKHGFTGFYLVQTHTGEKFRVSSRREALVIANASKKIRARRNKKVR